MQYLSNEIRYVSNNINDPIYLRVEMASKVNKEIPATLAHQDQSEP